MTADRLRDVPVLASLSDEEIVQLAEAGHERTLADGEFLFYQGDRASDFHVVLDGKLETTREVAGEQVLMMSHGPGGFLGAMALLTDTSYRGSTFAVGETVLFEVDGDELRRLAFTHAALMRQFLPAMESVSGAVKGIERDREKLLAVGSLAAGLAHELNNPAAAAARAVATLGEYERQRAEALADAAAAGASAEQLAALVAIGGEATPGERLDPLAESDREEELIEALERRGVTDGYRVASELTEAGLGRSGSRAWRPRSASSDSGPACATWPLAPGRACCSVSSRRQRHGSRTSSARSRTTPTWIRPPPDGRHPRGPGEHAGAAGAQAARAADRDRARARPGAANRWRHPARS